MADELVPSVLRELESFRSDLRAALDLEQQDLDGLVKAVELQAEPNALEFSLRDTYALLSFLSSRAATSGLSSESAIEAMEEMAAELDREREFQQRRGTFERLFAPERAAEEIEQRDLAIGTRYSGSAFRLIVVTSRQDDRRAVAGIHWALHLHGVDGDSETVELVLTQLQAESLRRSLDEAINELRATRQNGSVELANSLRRTAGS